jgi:NitT/TauT family transport system substrate-binding protein
MPTNTFRVLTALVTATAAGAALTACGADEGDSSKLTVAVTTPSWNAGFATLLVSQAKGYFEDEGLEVEFTLPPSGTQAAQQVIGGGADVALVTPEPVVIGATKGTELTYFANYYGDWIYGLATLEGSPIDEVADLAGKRIGVTNVSSSGATYAKVAMRLAGVNPDDAEFVPIGVGAQQITAIKDNQVDVLALWDTQYQIVRNAGITINELSAQSLDGMFGGGFVARGSELESNQDAFVKFGRAIAKGVVYAQANPEAAIRTMWKAQPDTAPGAGTSEDEALAQQVKVLETRLEGLGIQEGQTRWGVMDPERVQRTIEFAEEAALIDQPVEADSIVDTGLLDKINDFSQDDIREQATAGT